MNKNIKSDYNDIVRMLDVADLDSEKNIINKFNKIGGMYDYFMRFLIRPKIHKANVNKHNQILKSVLLKLENIKILDVACGTGDTIKYLKRSNTYTGMDISYNLLLKSKKRIIKKGIKNYNLIEGNASKMPFENNSFDFIICNTAFHMISDVEKVAGEIYRVLKKDKLFFVNCPVLGINIRFDRSWEKIKQKKRKMRSIKFDFLKNVLIKTGFSLNIYNKNGGIVYFECIK